MIYSKYIDLQLQIWSELIKVKCTTTRECEVIFPKKMYT